MNIKRSLLITVLFTIVFAFITGTLSYLIWQTGESKRIAVNFSVPGVCSVLVDGGGEVDASMIDMYPATCTDTTATIVKEINLNVEFQKEVTDVLVELWLNVNSIDTALSNSKNFRYMLSKSDSNCYDGVVSSGTFNGAVDGNKIKILEETYVGVYPHTVEDTYYLYIWLDEAETSLETVGKSFSLSLGGNCASVGVSTNVVTKPVLDEGMIPVTIADDGTVTTVSETNPNWYNYDEKKWANAVLVNESGTQTRDYYKSNTGIEVNQSDILAYYTWIPRYSYKIPSKCSEVDNPTMETHPSCYDGDTVDTFNGETALSGARPIDILFETNNSSMLTGDAVSTYRTHPAFWWDYNSNSLVDSGETLAGIWVGKFETSTDTTSECYADYTLCNTANEVPRILPNVYSLRYQYIGNQFTTSQKFSASGNIYGISNTNTDAHMMKNSEWGAVAYLSHSQYGINYEIRINNNSKYTTGCGASEENGEESTTCEIAYGGATSYPQSTTGNITGVFDMSGGAYEYVMGNYNNTAHSTYFPTLPDSKYYDVYLSTQFTGDYSTNMSLCTLETCGGHALSETAGWYDDYAYFVSSDYPWFIRGGDYGNGAVAGAFHASFDNGVAYSGSSWRSVLIPLDSTTNNDIVATISSTNNMADSQTVTLDWEKNEDIVSYYWGTAHPYSGVAWTDASSVSNVTKTVSEPGTYYLGIKDSSGDITVMERVFYETNFAISNATASYNSIITMAGNSINLPEVTADSGYVFLGWYTKENGGGDALSGAYTPTYSSTLYAYVRANVIIINYYTDGGILDSSTTDGIDTYTWTQEASGLINLNGTTMEDVFGYDQTVNLTDYNDSNYMNITKQYYEAVEGAEWICIEGCTTENATFDQNKSYETDDFCDASTGPCTVSLKVNWYMAATVINANRYKLGYYNGYYRMAVYYVTKCQGGMCDFTSKYGFTGAFTGVDYFGDTTGVGQVAESSISASYSGVEVDAYYTNGYNDCYVSASKTTKAMDFPSGCTLRNFYLTGHRSDTSNDTLTRWYYYPEGNCYVLRNNLYAENTCGG